VKRRLLSLVAISSLAVAAFVTWRARSGPGEALPASETAPHGDGAQPEVPQAPLERPAEDAPDQREAALADSPDPLEDPAAVGETAEGIPVLVVTGDGTPVAGVPVALLMRVESMNNSEGRSARDTTDARGRALLVEEEEERVQRERMRSFTDVELLFRVEAQVPLPERPTHELGSEPVASEPIRLVLPPCGGIRVHVSTPDGGAVPEASRVFPFWRPVGSDGSYDRIGTPREPVVGGVATFATLPLGQEFQFNVGGGKAYRGTQAFALGPAQVGEVVDVEAVLGPPLATVTGVLVGEDGQPLTDVSVSMGLFLLDRLAPADAEPERVQWLWTELDGQGRFARATALEPDETQRLALAIREESRHTPSEVDRFARWDGAVELPPGEVLDVGTLVLRPHRQRRLLAAGRVLSTDGEPLPHPQVSIHAWDPDSRRWERLAEDRVEVDRDGFFEAHTILEELPERFTVSAGARGYLGASVEASPGERGLELLLSRGGGVAGRFVADDAAALPLLSVLIEGEDFSREPDSGFGHFRVDGLPPGTFSVIAKGHGTDWRFGGIDDVVVPQGEFAVDPRLERIDLGDACRVLRLTVLDPDGQPIPKQHVFLQDRAGDGGSFRSDEQGELVALVPAGVVEIGLTVTYRGEHLGALWSTAAGYSGRLTLGVRDR